MLPMAALLLRFDQPGLLSVAFITRAGGAAFDNLALIFAIGVALSWPKGSAGVATLAGVVGYFVLTKAMVTISPEISMNILTDITTGLAGDTAYNRWSDIKLPDFLNFFGGKRFVSVATDFFCPMLAVVFGYVWLPVQHAIYAGGGWIVSAGTLGFDVFDFINRLLTPAGLHQVLSTTARFQIGEFINAAGTVFHGDASRFCAGDGTAGMFIFDFFSIMIPGPSGAAPAMYFATSKEHHPMVGETPPSVIVTASLAGVTESLKFLLMSLAPPLCLLHILLTDISLFVATLLGIRADLSFSTGVTNHTLMYNLPAANQSVWILLVMRVAFFTICFMVFDLVIRMFNLKIPGREGEGDKIVTEEANNNTEENLNRLTTNYVAAVGGTDNLETIDACITRLRLTVVDLVRIDNAMYKRLGVSGIVKLNKQAIQMTVGTKAEPVDDTMKKVVAHGPIAAALTGTTPAAAAPVTKPQAVPNAVSIAELVSPITGDVVTLNQVPNKAFVNKAMDDGVAVKPTDRVVISPAAGVIVKVFNTDYAFCLKTEKGTKIAVHVGIDTVALESKGSKRPAGEDMQVDAGRPVLEMGLDYLDANARSMISPVVCNNIDDFSGLIIKVQSHVVAGQTPLYEIKK